ncbi:EF-hand domain-containing protein [Ottowia testudinis]|uniref:EF-hand domain-containing protein n=1 Tax=Ottowia testudinis TaxID=2816950 RepID=A0A975CFM0_9BURK|nr:EF-hand domain-containing protein [Ottowia testudinis]QTD44664.1 EF-hand domain-containing protein [Ottowia testudinis]
MTFHRSTLLCLLTALACTPALAQSAAVAATRGAPQAAPSKGEAQALQWFSMLDANGDGRISLDEAKVAFRLKPSLREYFKAADLNGDGHLTQQEIRTVADRQRAERQARRQREAQATSTPVAPLNAAAVAPKSGTAKKTPAAPISPR